jgi:hypothetical protein
MRAISNPYSRHYLTPSPFTLEDPDHDTEDDGTTPHIPFRCFRSPSPVSSFFDADEAATGEEGNYATAYVDHGSDYALSHTTGKATIGTSAASASSGANPASAAGPFRYNACAGPSNYASEPFGYNASPGPSNYNAVARPSNHDSTAEPSNDTAWNPFSHNASPGPSNYYAAGPSSEQATDDAASTEGTGRVIPPLIFDYFKGASTPPESPRQTWSDSDSSSNPDDGERIPRVVPRSATVPAQAPEHPTLQAALAQFAAIYEGRAPASPGSSPVETIFETEDRQLRDLAQLLSETQTADNSAGTDLESAGMSATPEDRIPARTFPGPSDMAEGDRLRMLWASASAVAEAAALITEGAARTHVRVNATYLVVRLSAILDVPVPDPGMTDSLEYDA